MIKKAHVIPRQHIFLLIAISVPIIAAILFTSIYALPTPLTDEWLMLENSMRLSAAPSTIAGIATAMGNMRWFIYEHPIIIPNLIYVLLMPHVHYDTRVLVAITLACFLAMVLAARWRGAAGIGSVAASFIVFSPAHYMEYFWGFQFAFALSGTITVIGLALIDVGMKADRRHLIKIIGGFVLIACGVLCSSGAIFGFFAALSFVTSRKLRNSYRTLVAIIATALFVLAAVWRQSERIDLDISMRNVYMVLTSFGGLLYSSPVGLSNFGVNARSISGALIVCLDSFIIFDAFKHQREEKISFAIALIVFGGMTISAVALARPYIGNWHLQLALPFMVGSAMLAEHAILERRLALKACAILLLATYITGIVGYEVAFSKSGPNYRQYAITITRYMQTLPENPDQPKPFPSTGGWNATPAMTKFLRDGGNPAFTK